jgi:hypothetical protein
VESTPTVVPIGPSMEETFAAGVDWVLQKRLSQLTGLTSKAIERKRQRGIWLEGVHYQWRDGRIYYSIKAYNAWVANRSSQVSRRTARRCVSPFRTTGTLGAGSS